MLKKRPSWEGGNQHRAIFFIGLIIIKHSFNFLFEKYIILFSNLTINYLLQINIVRLKVIFIVILK